MKMAGGVRAHSQIPHCVGNGYRGFRPSGEGASVVGGYSHHGNGF